MRIVTVALALIAAALLGIAALLGQQTRDFLRAGVVAPGVVTRLNAGPLHADVTVSPAAGHPFVYAENGGTAPLAMGQRVRVRYLAEAPAQTARLADGDPYALARGFAWAAAAVLAAALASPWLVARFPGLLAYPIRP